MEQTTITSFHNVIISRYSDREPTSTSNYYTNMTDCVSDVLRTIVSSDCISEGELVLPNDTEIVVDFENKVRDSENGHSMFVGEVKIGDGFRDGRSYINRRKISYNGSSFGLNISENMLNQLGIGTPPKVEIWGGDGVIAIASPSSEDGYAARLPITVEQNTTYLYITKPVKKALEIPPSASKENIDCFVTSIEFDYNSFENIVPALLTAEKLPDTNEFQQKIISPDDSLASRFKISPPDRLLNKLSIDQKNPVGESIFIRAYQDPELPDLVFERPDTKQIKMPDPDVKKRVNETPEQAYYDAIKQAADDLSEPLGADEYREWAREKVEQNEFQTNVSLGGSVEMKNNTPSLDRICEWSSFSKLCEEAGIETRATGPTQIETEIHSILKELDIKYTVQKKVDNPDYSGKPFKADVLVDDHDLVIEADGNFWHGHPEYFEGFSFQVRSVKRDPERDKIFSQQGYDVIRFWESSIVEQRQRVKTEIKRIVVEDGDFVHGQHVLGPEPPVDKYIISK